MLLKIALFFHVISAIFWVGGMLFLVFVVAPYLMTLTDPAEKSKIYQVVGKQYRFWGWIAIILLLVTGPIVLYALYGVSPGGIFDPAFHATPFGRTLAVKLTFVTLIVLSSLFHDFYLGPNARTSPKISRWARVFGRTNLLLALIIVILAVILRTGGI
ncbi:MAG: DUF4149 domain-containing protein [Deltaproteobacteria bacterium]|nr:DUF4149 domain-containing protein [Deltaproteobacteria bacterium]